MLREDLEMFGFTARCPRVHVVAQGTARQAHTENCRRRMDEELRGIVQVEAAQRRVKEYQNQAAKSGTKRTKSSSEEGQTDASTTTAPTNQQTNCDMFTCALVSSVTVPALHLRTPSQDP